VIEEKLSKLLGTEVSSLHYLTTGQIGGVHEAIVNGQRVVVKESESTDNLPIEAKMLADLKEVGLLVPKVIACTQEYLVMEYIQSSKLSSCASEIAAAEQLAALHKHTNEGRMYGYYYDTTIGPLVQVNEQTQYNWALFLGQMRILPMAKLCYDKGVLPKALLERLERLCRDLYKYIDMSAITPSLLHGDVWSGNVIFNKEGAHFIDPAIYYGDREMELAFILLFDTFGERFFGRYAEEHPLSEDFYEVKVPLYQIYPTLVHVALYGASYLGGLEELLKKLKLPRVKEI